jgi:hypothetical protein
MTLLLDHPDHRHLRSARHFTAVGYILLIIKVPAELLSEPGRGRDDGRHPMRLIVLPCIHMVDPRVNDTRVTHAVGAVALAL